MSADGPRGWPHEGPAFHDGERAVQRRAGVEARMDALGRRFVRGHMPDEHRELFEKLPFLVLGVLDARGRPWATLLPGRPGFVSTPDDRTLRVGARPLGEGTLPIALRRGAPVGLLGIEPSTRRRNRVNGTVRHEDGEGLAVDVVQSFGNCPKHIHPRALRDTRTPGRSVRFADRLPAEASELLARADTLFLASAAPRTGDASEDVRRGVDVSHRGGPAGFVAVDADPDGGAVLRMPDYAGNAFFNTLGNLAVFPFLGLLVVDFERGDVLCLTGRADVIWEGLLVARHENADRVVVMHVEEGVLLPGALPFTTV